VQPRLLLSGLYLRVFIENFPVILKTSDKGIDAYVYKAYGLTEEEVRVVEAP
jgi:hypothetical protein